MASIWDSNADELRYAREQSSPFAALYDYIRSQGVDLAAEGRRPVLGGLLSKEPVAGVDTLRYEGVMPMIAGLLGQAARGVDAPAAAAGGFIPAEDVIGEAFNTAGAAMAGGAGAAVPEDALLAGLARVNKADLDPLGYQKTKMRDYLTNTQLDKVDLGENLARTPASWEDMLGKLVMPFYGDRTSRGYLLSGIDDTVFDRPVYTEGGVDFKRGPAAQKDRAIWASNNNIITRIAKEADKARQKYDESDIYGMTGSMAPDANDFATMTGAAMAEMVRAAPIKKAAAEKFDEAMRKFDPEFVGVRSPLLRDWAETTTSPNRKAFIRLMDSAPMQDAGFPSPAQVRYGVTDPTQREMPAGMFGLGVSKLDEVAPILRNNPKGNMPGASFPHSTYNTQITGDYFGSLPPVPQGLLFRDVYDRMEGKKTKSGQPLSEAHKTHAIKTIMPVQRITEPVLEGILGYLSRLEK